jgi:hypothetical protein
MVTCIIPHYYNEHRYKNLAPIVETLRGQVGEVIIWNNDSPIDPVPGARIIQADHNWGCQGRFAAAKELSEIVGEANYVLFHDNDLITHPNSLSRLRHVLEWNRGHIATITGEVRRFKGVDYFLSRGRYELMELDTLRQILEFWTNGPESVHDDIWLSVRAIELKIARFHVHVSWRDLDDPVGFWKSMPRAQWEATRQQVFESLMKEPHLAEVGQ